MTNCPVIPRNIYRAKKSPRSFFVYIYLSLSVVEKLCLQSFSVNGKRNDNNSESLNFNVRKNSTMEPLTYYFVMRVHLDIYISTFHFRTTFRFIEHSYRNQNNYPISIHRVTYSVTRGISTRMRASRPFVTWSSRLNRSLVLTIKMRERETRENVNNAWLLRDRSSRISE